MKNHRRGFSNWSVHIAGIAAILGDDARPPGGQQALFTIPHHSAMMRLAARGPAPVSAQGGHSYLGYPQLSNIFASRWAPPRQAAQPRCFADCNIPDRGVYESSAAPWSWYLYQTYGQGGCATIKSQPSVICFKTFPVCGTHCHLLPATDRITRQQSRACEMPSALPQKVYKQSARCAVRSCFFASRQ